MPHINQLNKTTMTTTNEIITANGLDFNISKRALFDGTGNPTSYFGLFNDKLNKCIHTVKDGYHVSQNSEVVDMVLAGIAPFGTSLAVQKAGVLNEGIVTGKQIGRAHV